MPVMDGIGLLEAIRAGPAYRHLPVIMLTASGQEADRRRAEAAGANGFLTKPAGSLEILHVVGEVLEERAP